MFPTLSHLIEYITGIFIPLPFKTFGFFIALAILNEIIWRTQSTDLWVSFKVFGILPITFIFTMTQFPLIKKYQIEN